MVPDTTTSMPRLEPWLMPETTRSMGSSISSAQARMTQSAGVPSTAKAFTPSSLEGSCCARTTDVRLIPAPTPLWSLSGATTVTLPTL